MNENEFATGSVPVMVAARIYGKDASWLRHIILSVQIWSRESQSRLIENWRSIF